MAALAVTPLAGKALASVWLALHPPLSDGVRAAFFRTLKVPVINLPGSFQFANNPIQTMCSALCARREEEGSSGLQTGQTSLPVRLGSERRLYLRANCLRELEIASRFGVGSAFSVVPEPVPAGCVASPQQIDLLADSRRLCLHSAGRPVR